MEEYSVPSYPVFSSWPTIPFILLFLSQKVDKSHIYIYIYTLVPYSATLTSPKLENHKQCLRSYLTLIIKYTYTIGPISPFFY